MRLGATEPTHYNSRALELQLLKPECPEPVPRNERGRKENPAIPNQREALTRHNSRKPACSNEDPVQPKVNE